MSASPEVPQQGSSPRWRRRVAAHLSIASLDKPVFAATARSLDPVDQLVAVAAAGFAGVSDNMLLRRSVTDQKRMARAMAELGLELGSISLSPVGAPQIALARPEAEVEQALSACADAAERFRVEGVGLCSVTAMVHNDQGKRLDQLDRVAQNLDRAAAFAEGVGLRIGLEAVSRRRVPSSLIELSAEAASIVEHVSSPALGLVLDSAHSWFAGDDLVDQLARYAPLLVTIQIADMPGRIEPGAGKIKFSGLEAALDAIGWTGLVEAEFVASTPGLDGEAAVLTGLDHLFG